MRTHYCLASKSYLLAMCFVLIVSCFAEAQLADKYRRNGEVYFLVGEQDKKGKPNPLKGIYRMNNPETQANYPEGGYRYIYNIDNTTGFVVTLERDIYTFTKTIDENAKNYVYRQVLDNIDYKKSDYGYHSYFHYDHRSSGAGDDIYRPLTGGRESSGTSNSRGKTRYKIKSVSNFYALKPDAERSGMTWAQVQAETPGYIYKDLAEKGTNVKLGIYNTNNEEMNAHGSGEALWYRLDKRNFTSANKTVWYTGRKKSQSGNCYATYGDTENFTKNDYKLCTWKSNNVASNESNPTYNKQGSDVWLGSTGGISLGRQVLAGCLDGCDGCSGNAKPVNAPLASASVAFQPKPKNSSTGDRSYFYSRVITSSDYTLTKTPNSLTPTMVPSDDDYLKRLNTYRIGVSIKDKDHDYLYALGDDVIKKWYDAYNAPNTLTGHKIKSVSVSNQWEQKGGIVFAYDSKKGYVYEFVRNEQASGEKAKIEDYRALKVQTLCSQLGLGSSENELDDLAADGYGNLYYTVSQPSGDPEHYNPKNYLKQKDITHIHKDYENSEGIVYGDAVFVQEFRKTIGKYDIQTESVSEVNRLVYATKVYSINFSVPNQLYNNIQNAPSNWYTQIKNWEQNHPGTCTVAGIKPTKSDVQKAWFQEGSGSCGCTNIIQSMALDYNNPGQTQLSVVNVPTPPEVKHLGPYKVSYLDVCGPYTSYPLPTSGGTGQRPADLSYASLANKTLYFFMVENYAFQSGTHSQDPKGHIDYDQDKRGSGFISTIKYPDKAYSDDSTVKSGITYEWKLWQVQTKVGDDDVNTCELVQEESGNSSGFGFWYYSKGKFILCCRARYTWYNYDKLEFGTTVDDRESCRENSWAWASKANSQVAFDQYKNTGTCDTSLCQNATSTDRLTEIMNLPEFSFMKNSPKDLDGNIINYRARILGSSNNPSDDKDTNNYWAMQPIVVPQGTAPKGSEFRVSVERCDEIVKKNATSPEDPNSYIYNSGSNSYWSLPLGEGNSFGLDCGKKYFWRMALASQTKLFTDISTTTKVSLSQMGDDDFNLVAYLLSSKTLPDGSNNTLYANADPDFQFNPNEAGSCWWYERTDSSGNKHAEIKANIGIEYKLPGQSNTETKTLVDNVTYDLNLPVTDPSGKGLKLSGSGSGLWSKFRPVIASIAVDLPVTDPFVATISVSLQRSFCYKSVLKKDGITTRQIKIGPIPIVLTGEASIRVIDTKEPEIVYAETPNVNLFGITGRPLNPGDGVNTYKNPQYVSFTLSDNNAWEAGTENGIGLTQHVQNYAYNYGSAACASYTAGSTKLSGVAVTSQEGVKKKIEDLMEQGKKTSHLNYKKVFSKSAVDTRFIFDTASYYKRNNSSPFEGGAVCVNKADSFKYRFNSSDPNTGYYVKDDSIFDSDNSEYAYNPALRGSGAPNSLLERTGTSLFTDTSGGKSSKSNYRILLTNIKMKNGQNMVPENYANNTPGYEPYHFYVRSTDCSGNYTYIPGDVSKLKKEYNLPLNIALHVKDDIPPVAFGKIFDTKHNNTMVFPQVGNSLGSETCPLDTNIASITHIPSAGGTGVPEFFGMTLDDSFLRAQRWYSADNDGNVVGSNNTYKTLFSFSPNNITTNTGMVIAFGQTVKNRAEFVAQLNNQVTPYYVEDNTLCRFSVNSMDNAGQTNATLYFKYLRTGLEAGGEDYGVATQNFIPYGTHDINGELDTTNYNENNVVASNSVVGLFRGPEYPMSIPILIITSDNAKEWDYYDGIVAKPGNIGKASNLFGTLRKGGDSPNTRYISTSLAVFKSGLDIKTLERSMKNN